MLPKHALHERVGRERWALHESAADVKAGKSRGEKAEWQEEILFDANDKFYATPMRKASCDRKQAEANNGQDAGRVEGSKQTADEGKRRMKEGTAKRRFNSKVFTTSIDLVVQSREKAKGSDSFVESVKSGSVYSKYLCKSKIGWQRAPEEITFVF